MPERPALPGAGNGRRAVPDARRRQHGAENRHRIGTVVRIAMTVAEAGTHEGRLLEVTKEEGLDTDAPNVALRETRGKINSDLTVGVDVTGAIALQANAFICSPGVKLHGDGFIV